jgi:cytochrome c553
MKPLQTLLLACVALMACGSLLAQGNAESGKQKAFTCTGCHGVAGYKNVYPHYHVPKIGGQNYEYLVAALTAYRNGERPHPTMRAQAEGFSEQDIKDIASYLAGLGAKP